MRINFTPESKSLTDEAIKRLDAICLNLPNIVRDHDDVPMAWDAGWEILHNPNPQLRITGGVGAGGHGSVVIQMPLIDCPYHIEAEPNDGMEEEVQKIFKAFGYAIPEQDYWRCSVSASSEDKGYIEMVIKAPSPDAAVRRARRALPEKYAAKDIDCEPLSIVDGLIFYG